MKSAFLTALVAATYGQDHCVYEFRDPHSDQKEPFVLNLTAISRWQMEFQTPEDFFYYSPCGNRIQCNQGNANFMSNMAQYVPGANQCKHYLSVDHHDRPDYTFVGDAWHFEYEDGEKCDVTQEPRRVSVFYHCNDVNHQDLAFIESIDEPFPCHYFVSIKSVLACVPENKYHANCQWKEQDSSGKYHYLDLSKLKGEVIRTDSRSKVGYEFYYSPCSNNLHCYQQGERETMAIIENRATGTCDHNLGVWEEGRAHPIIAENSDPPHWSFHYWNGDRCSDGRQGEFHVRWFCDQDVEDYKVIDDGVQGDCDFYLNISTKYACMDEEPRWVPAKQAFA